mmetsp:Transcript_21260/g.56274  ORF Transcript_21260/g.56274 Transcript_21260/m.56274 type:complete len:253 (-) Transcript_21260:98-856(-)
MRSPGRALLGVPAPGEGALRELGRGLRRRRARPERPLDVGARRLGAAAARLRLPRSAGRRLGEAGRQLWLCHDLQRGCWHPPAEVCASRRRQHVGCRRAEPGRLRRRHRGGHVPEPHAVRGTTPSIISAHHHDGDEPHDHEHDGHHARAARPASEREAVLLRPDAAHWRRAKVAEDAVRDQRKHLWLRRVFRLQQPGARSGSRASHIRRQQQPEVRLRRRVRDGTEQRHLHRCLEGGPSARPLPPSRLDSEG